jgi:hypothetical protein
MGFAERGALLHRFADLIEANADALTLADTTDMGKPIWLRPVPAQPVGGVKALSLCDVGEIVCIRGRCDPTARRTNMTFPAARSARLQPRAWRRSRFRRYSGLSAGAASLGALT